jgi:hypothetical protein
MPDYSVTYRFAPYVESQHDKFLQISMSNALARLDTSPYDGAVALRPEDAFFGVGYILSSFPSLYDMYGKFMAGLDLEKVWTDIFTERVDRMEVSNYTQQLGINDQVEIDSSTLPSYYVGVRDVNAISSSSFLIGKALIVDSKMKSLSVNSTYYRLALLDLVMKGMKDFLNWMDKVIVSYSFLMKQYYTEKQVADSRGYTYTTKETLWPFTVLDFIKSFLMAMKQPRTFNYLQEARKRSTISGTLLIASNTWTGAYIGFQIGGPVGAVIGGVIGFVIGVAQWMLE